MVDALVFGPVNSLASKLADALSDRLRVRVRYQRHAEENAAPGVAICTSAEAFTTNAPILLCADDARDSRKPDPDRTLVLATLAEAAALGRYVAIIGSRAEAGSWVRHAKAAQVPTERPLKRVTIIGEPGVGKSTLAAALSPILGLPIVSIDEEYWGDERGADGADGREARLEEIASRESWIAEGAYRSVARNLAPRADATMYLDLPTSVARQHRAEREARVGPVKRPLKERLIVAFFRRSYPVTHQRQVRAQLSAAAHLAPVFCIRTEAERDAVTEAFARGAAAPNPPAS